MVKKILSYIEKWVKNCYKEGIPDECPVDIERNLLAPSYRQICIAIMKNDTQLKTLGMDREKCKAYSELKRAELIDNGKIKKCAKLF
jgi:predicted phosphoadenosine phosphosulfate sulfurtransferase